MGLGKVLFLFFLKKKTQKICAFGMLMHEFSLCKKFAFKKELEKHEVLNPYLLNNEKDCYFK